MQDQNGIYDLRKGVMSIDILLDYINADEVTDSFFERARRYL